MRNRRTQRALRRAGVRREEKLDARNIEHYADPTPAEAVERIRKERKRRGRNNPI